MWAVAAFLSFSSLIISLIDTFSTPLIHRTVFDWCDIVLALALVIVTGARWAWGRDRS